MAATYKRTAIRGAAKMANNVPVTIGSISTFGEKRIACGIASPAGRTGPGRTALKQESAKDGEYRGSNHEAQQGFEILQCRDLRRDLIHSQAGQDSRSEHDGADPFAKLPGVLFPGLVHVACHYTERMSRPSMADPTGPPVSLRLAGHEAAPGAAESSVGTRLPLVRRTFRLRPPAKKPDEGCSGNAESDEKPGS